MPEPASSNAVTPEMLVIRTAVRITVVAISGVAVVIALVQTAAVAASLTTLQTATAFASAILMALAIGLRHVAPATWLAVASMVAVVLSVTAAPSDSFARVQVSTAIFLTAYCGVLLLKRVPGLVWLAASAIGWVLVTGPVPLSIEVNGAVVDMRVVTLLQLVVSALWLWAAWHRELDEVRRRDALSLATEVQLAKSLADREATLAWRQSVVRTHETVLNDIRYLIDSPEVNRESLSAQLAARTPLTRPASDVRLDSLLTELRARPWTIRVVPGSFPPVRISTEVSVGLDGVLTEVLRNLERHGGAKTAVLSAAEGTAETQILIGHDGVPSTAGQARGIGTTIVIAETLSSIGGAMSESEGLITITVPAQQEHDEPVLEAPSFGPSLPGASAVTAGNALGGLPFYLLLVVTGGLAGAVSGIAAAACTALATLAAVRRVALPTVLMIVAIAAAMTVPLASVGQSGGCSEASVQLDAAILASFAATGVVMWAAPRLWWLVAGPLVAVALLMRDLFPACPTLVESNVGSLLAPAVFLGLVLVGLRVGSRSSQAAAERMREQVRNAAAAAAEADLGAQLGSAVENAAALIRQVADGAEVDDETRRRLQCLDGEIRAALQTGVAAGGLTRLAVRMVRDCVRIGQPVHVQSLRDSGADVELPTSMEQRMRQMMTTSSVIPAVQVFTTSTEDTLVITGDAASGRAAGLDSGWREELSCGYAEAELSEADDVAVLLVHCVVRAGSRPMEGAEVP